MSKKRIDYVLIGEDIGYCSFDDTQPDIYEEYRNQTKVNDFTYLIDKERKYFFVGEVLQVSLDGTGLDFDLSNINEEDLADIKRGVKGFIYAHFGVEYEPSLLVISHFIENK